MIENEDYVVCRICGWKGKQITTSHLQLSHRIKAKDYKERFPDAILTCRKSRDKMKLGQMKYQKENPNVRKEHSEKIKRWWKIEENRKRILETFKNRPPQTEEKKKRISESMKRVYRETDLLKIKSFQTKGEKNPFYGKNHSEETKQYLKEITTRRLKEGYANGTLTSPFKYLGQSNQKSSYEKVAYDYLVEELDFIFDLVVPFSKGSYRIDFARKDLMLGIELDSKLHLNEKAKEKDRRKDKYLESLGWRIVRIPFNTETPQEVLQKVKDVINENKINKKKSNHRNFS